MSTKLLKRVKKCVSVSNIKPKFLSFDLWSYAKRVRAYFILVCVNVQWNFYLPVFYMKLLLAQLLCSMFIIGILTRSKIRSVLFKYCNCSVLLKENSLWNCNMAQSCGFEILKNYKVYFIMNACYNDLISFASITWTCALQGHYMLFQQNRHQLSLVRY